MGDIGPGVREIEVLPAEAPLPAPAPEPVETPEHEEVPA